jgi:hypothetical protein
MRTRDQIDNIKKTISDPYVIEDFITFEDIAYLTKLFEEHSNIDKTHKNTGPITLDLHCVDDDIVVSKLINNLQNLIGPFEITAAFFFKTSYPHIIHNDDTFELPDTVFKAITIPLKTYGSDRVPDLCFFDQFYFHGPAKFFNGDSNIPTHYNKQIYDYIDVDGVSDTMLIDESTRITYFTHLKSNWLTGLTMWGSLKWKPTSALIFDSVRLHCASDFRKLNIQSKLGISIFTKKK